MLKGLIIASLITLAGHVLAATPQETAKARTTVTEARQHYNLGAFDLALKGYQEAYKLTDDAMLLFNIGQCQWKLGDDKAALHSYRAYLRSSANPNNLPMVEARIAELEKKLKSAEQGLPASQKPAASPAPEAPPVAAALPLPAGPAPARRTPAALPLPRPDGAAAAPHAILTPVGPAREDRAVFYTRWWFWTALGAVVAGGMVLAMVASPGGPSTPSCPDGASCDL